RSGRQLLEQAVLPIVDACVARDLRQVAADQRELVMAIEVADAPQPIGGSLVVEMAAERIAGISRIRDHRARAQPLSCEIERSLLRIERMEVEPLRGHRLLYSR